MKRLALLALVACGCGKPTGISVEVIVMVDCPTVENQAQTLSVVITANGQKQPRNFPAQDFLHNERTLEILLPDTTPGLNLDLSLFDANGVLLASNSLHFSLAGAGDYHETAELAGCGPSDGGSSDAGVTSPWLPIASPKDVTLRAVWSSGNGTWYAVGDQGTSLLSSDQGQSWQSVGIVTNLTLNAVWGDISGNVWEAGAGGRMFHQPVNQPWKEITPCGGEDLYGMTGDGGGNVYAVGDKGTVCKMDSFDLFLPSPIGAAPRHSGVYLANQFIFVGDGGDLLILDGSGEHPGMVGMNDLESVSGNGVLFAVGASGVAYTATDPTKWTPSDTRVTNNLFSVWASGKEAYAVGEKATILHTENGGSTWAQELAPTMSTNVLYGVYSSNGVVIAVGDNGTILRRKN
jgi:photosystem II stability/assembly factor-like uncharacterized protein